MVDGGWWMRYAVSVVFTTRTRYQYRYVYTYLVFYIPAAGSVISYQVQ